MTTLTKIAITIGTTCGAVTTAEVSHLVTLPHWVAGAVALLGIVAAAIAPSAAPKATTPTVENVAK